MHKTSVLALSALATACIPKLPDELDTATGGATASSGGEQTAGSTSGDSSGGDSTSSGPTSMDPTVVPTTAASETTTEGVLCPLDPPFTPQWSNNLVLPPPEGDTWLVESIATLSDGRLAIAGATRTNDLTFAPGVLWVAPDGQPIEWIPGALTPATNIEITGLRVAGDDSVVLVGPQLFDTDTFRPYVSRFAPGGSELGRVDVQTEHLNDPLDFELHDGGIVLSGRDRPTNNFWLAKVDVATGKPAWEVMLPGFDVPIDRHVAVGPDGQIAAGSALWPNEQEPLFKVWRLDGAGAVVWERDLLKQGPSSGRMVDLAILPGGQVVAATMWGSPVAKIALTALSPDDGAIVWELDVAVEDDTGSPLLKRMFLDGDALALPLVHAKDFWDQGVPSSMHVELQRVTFDGASLPPGPLAPGDELGSPWLVATRGACGDLVLFQNTFGARGTPWLGSFAP